MCTSLENPTTTILEDKEMAELEKCQVLGCIHHIEAECTSGKPAKVTYKYRVHFRNLAEVYKYAMDRMNRAVQFLAREDKPIPVKDDGTFVDIYGDCSLVKTAQERLDELDNLSVEEVKIQADLYMAVLKKKLEEAQKAQSVHAGMNDKREKK